MKNNTTSIFDPYDRNNYDEEQIENGFLPINPVLTIQDKLIRSNGLFGDHHGNATDDSIYVYEISGDYAVLQLEISKYTKNRVKDEYMAFAFYDKSLLGADEKFGSIEDYKTVYQMWHFGSIKRKDMMSKKDWITVPREIFSNVNDHVYLCICTEKGQGAPVVKGVKFPNDRLFFYDLPVATSVYEGQKLKDSRILLGKVMDCCFISQDPELKTLQSCYRDCLGVYEWLDEEQEIVVDDELEFECRSTEDYEFVYNGKRFGCPAIELNIYKKSPNERQKDITAFVWQSGNDDDEVKKSYLESEPGCPHPYNKYSYIMDCLSSHTMYRSMVSLTKFTTYNAARYAVRTLAKQPKGNRCFSIDGNNLVFLMGGALFKIETIVTNAYVEEGILSDEEFNKKFKKDFEMIEDLYAFNGSHLFFDNPVKEVKVKQAEADYYMKDVLGIKPNSQETPNPTSPNNGCDAIKSLLTSLFAEIKRYGVELDYVYCDIEGPWNDIRALSARRFNATYVYRYPEDELDRIKGHVILENTDKKSGKLKKYFDRIVITDLQKREELWKDMQHRGFSLSEKTLGDLVLASDLQDNKESLYGLSRYLLTYERRRDPNIWDAVMKGYENKLYYQYVIKPVLESYPQAKCSVYGHAKAQGYINHAKRFETYLGGSVQQYPEVYSCGALYGNVSGEYYKKLCMDNWKMFPNKRDFFSYFVGNINLVRNLLLSSQTKELKNGKFNAFIGSFNMWVNGYLTNDDFVDKIRDLNKLKTDEEEIIEKLQLYYNEFMFHVFLCCPDKVNAYFYVEKKAINDQGRTDDGGSYYFPFGDPNVTQTHKDYYIDSYSKLQAVLEELNGLVEGNPCVTKVKTLAIETDPFVVSGVEFADKTLWRITLNEYLTPDTVKPYNEGLTINTSTGKQIMFAEGVRLVGNGDAESSNQYGLWVETPATIQPTIISTANYYESNPAFVKRPVMYNDLQVEIANYPNDMAREMRRFVENELPEKYIEEMVNKKVNDKIKEEHLNLSEEQLRALKESIRQEVINGLIAENKKKRVDNLEFAIVKNFLRYKLPTTYTVFGETPVLFTWSMKFKVNKVEDVYTKLLFRSNESFDFVLSGGNNGLEVWTEKKSEQPVLGNEKLVVGECYELRKYVALVNDVTSVLLSGKARFELWRLTNDGNKHLVLGDNADFKYENPDRYYVYQTYMDVLHPITDVIAIEEFKAFISQQHEKLELFRESDGVNIGRVNKQVDSYRDLPVETASSDTLIGKLSWLNATDKPVEYNISYKLDGITQPIDNDFATINVEAYSEGYVLIPLPPLKDSTKNAELTCEKQKITVPDIIGGVETSFFVDHHNRNSIKTVSVDIVPIEL